MVDIKLKKSSVVGRVPGSSDLAYGELAINYADGRLFYKDASNGIKAFIDSASTSTLVTTTIDSDYINARVASLDSSQVTSIVDSDYVLNRTAASFPILNQDSSLSHYQKFTFSVVSQNGAVRLQPQATYLDSGGTSLLANIDLTTPALDSSSAISLIDSAYVTARVSAVDSAQVLQIADSDYIKTVQYGDNDILKFGDGGDLEIFHDGSNSQILEKGTGSLLVRSPFIALKNQNNTEVMAQFSANGAVTLYHDNSKKLETTDSGVLVSGGLSTNYLAPVAGATYTPPSGSGSDTSTVTALALRRGQEISLGYNGFVRNLLQSTSSGDIQIGDGATGLFGEIRLQPGSSSGVQLGYNGANYKLNTTDSGVNITGSLRVNNAPFVSGGGGGGSSAVNQIKVNSYTGDSSTVSFTLSEAPASGSENSVIVTINGVAQHVNSYSLSGSNIILDSAPETGDEIEMRVHSDVIAQNLISAVDSDFTTTTANQIVDTFTKTLYRTTKYIAQIEHDSDNKYHSEEILLTHNGTTVAMTTYAQLLLDSNLGSFDADITGTLVRLKFTPTYTNTSVKLRAIRTSA